MQKRIVITMALALCWAGFASLPQAASQETAKQTEGEIKPTDSYKVDFTVSELDSGKKINSRSYSMQIRAVAIPKYTDAKRLRVNSQVPIATETNTTGSNTANGATVQYQYRNVGMDIDCRLMPMENSKVSLITVWDYSSVGDNRIVSRSSAGNPTTELPVIRNVRSEVEAVVPLDKPTVISEVDDVASTHRYVFEVKVTKINP